MGIAQALSLSLRQWYRVLEPVTSLEFLPVALTIASPEILILDLSFGLDSALHRLPDLLRQFPHVRIVIFTNHDEEIFVEVTRRIGAHGFLSKTASMEELCAEISRVLIDKPVAGAQPPIHQPCHRAARRDLSRQDVHRAILWLVASRYTHAQAAEIMGVSVKTIEYHTSRERSTA